MTLVALTREIAPSLVDACELTHLERSPISLDKARAEHSLYEDALTALGCSVQRLPADVSMADSVFIEDTAVVLDELAVITRPGAASRRAETAGVAEALRAYREIAAIEAPGTLDGGDVIRIGKRLLVGAGARSNEDGIAQLRALTAPHGYTVEAVPFRGCLHLKSAATMVDDDLALVNPDWVDARHLGVQTLRIDPAEPMAANALRVDGTLVYGAEYPRTRVLLERAGLLVRVVPSGELARAEGAVTCCSLLFRSLSR